MPVSLTASSSFILQSISLVLPLFFAGIGLIYVLHKNYFAKFNKPIDANATLFKKRVFGNNKTWRGVLIYIVLAVIISYLLSEIKDTFPNAIHALFNKNFIYVGLLFSLSYISGELINSFLKRQRGIAPGQQTSFSQKVIDNIDGMITVSIVLVLVGVSLSSVLLAVSIGAVIHLTTDKVMKRLGLKH